MKLPFTQKMLMDWAGPRVFREAQSIQKQGYVIEVEYDPPYVRGAITRGTRPLKTSLKLLKDGSAENCCPCYDSSERGIICSHVIALCLELLRQANDPERQAKLEEERRRAARAAGVDQRGGLHPAGAGGQAGRGAGAFVSGAGRELAGRGADQSRADQCGGRV
jgi:uncharacterized Zn finger protein